MNGLQVLLEWNPQTRSARKQNPQTVQDGVLKKVKRVALSKGNIRVFCRVRPVSQEEQDSADAKTMLSFDSEDDAVLHLSSKGKTMSFELDKVFPPQASQEEVSCPRGGSEGPELVG